MSTPNPSTPRLPRSIVLTNEKVTGPPGRHLLSASGIFQHPPNAVQVLDNASGGGVLAFDLLAGFREVSKDQPDRLLAGDIDDNILEYLRQRCTEENINNIETAVIDQQKTDLPDSTFTHVFNNFGVFFSADNQATVGETYRILKSNGIAGFTSWKSIAWWPAIAVPALRASLPEAPELPDPSMMFAATGWSDPKTIEAKLKHHGFGDVQAEPFRFTPEVPHVEFAEAITALIKIVAKKAWDQRAFESYANQIEPAVVQYLEQKWPQGKWDGEMTAIVTTGRKGGSSA